MSKARWCGVLVILVVLVAGTRLLEARANTVAPSSSAVVRLTSTVVGEASYRVLGRPSVSVALLNQVLQANGSPAAGLGQALYDDGVRYGIDPVFALEFFGHESSFGKTGIGAANKSLGNIRCSAGYRCAYGFRWYATWQAGFADWYTLIKVQYVQLWGLKTVAQIVPVYAPARDHNDVRAYIQAVERSVDRWRAGQV